MRKSILLSFLFFLFPFLPYAQFAPGNLAILQADASANNTTCSVIEINTTSAGQSPIFTVAIAGTGASALRFSGSATSTGYLANSNDGTLLCFTGANNINTSSNVNTLNPRGVGVLNSSQIFNLATTYTGTSGNQTRGATSLDNSIWYIGDQGGIYTNGTSSASPSGNIRSVKFFGGAVYGFTASASSGPVFTISAASGGSFTNLPGLANGTSNHQDFFLISSGSNGSSYDVLYVLAASSNTAGTIFKYSFVSGSWNANGSYTTAFGGFGLAAQTAGGGAYLYVSTGQGALTANNVIKLNDEAGYNSTINVTTANNVILYTAPAGKIIKGVAFAPVTTVNLSVSTNSGTEAGTTAVTVTATASSAVTSDQTVSVGVTGAGITAADYLLSNNTITILNGTTTGSVTFTIADDPDAEGTETATLTISAPSPGITLGTTTTQNIIITDNDSAPTPTVNLSVDVNNGSEAAATVVTVTATASTVVTGAQTISLGVTGTGITAGDYSLSTTTITIPDGATAGSVTFTITDDAIVEGTETATLTISNPSPGITLGATTTQNIDITDNDVAPAVNLSVSSNIASEAAVTAVTITVTASAAVTGDQTVSLAVAGAGITAGDYNLSNATITILNGNTSGSVTFTIADDAVAEGPEIVTLTISSPSPGITLGTITTKNINVIDNDVPLMRITEYMYNGSEFVEFTNVGNTSIDMTGWSFDDASRTPGAFSLTGFSMVQAGESVILSEVNEGSFRTTWGLCSGIKIVGGNNQNLGNGDEINLYNASSVLVDRITFGSGTTTGPQANNISAWVSALGTGTNLHSEWTLSSVADAEGSFISASGGFIGSPGKSTRATVVYDPCVFVPGAPTIIIDVATTTNYLDGGVLTSPASPYAISSVINDANDPASTMGLDFTLGDDVTPVGSLTVTATSNSPSVVPNANLVLTGTGASRNLKITATGAGYANITVTVNDGTYNTFYIINYASSSLTSSAGTHWHTGNSDASAVIALDDDYMALSDDEKNIFFVFDRDQSGLSVQTYDFNQSNILQLTDGSTNNWKEVDVEAATRAIADPTKIYWMGSMSNSSNSPFEDKPNRNRLFAVTVSGTGSVTTFSNAGHYSNLRQQLINWGEANGYDFITSAANHKDPKEIDGFNIEGMVFGPDNLTMYIGFRAPLVPIANRTKAVIAPIQNFEIWFNNGSPAGNPIFGLPIELDLGGRGIRDMIRLSNSVYIILAGSYDETLNPAVYRWTGHAGDAALLIPSFNVSGLNIEGAMPVNEGGQLSLNKLQFISDDGSVVFYGDNIEAKDLPADNFKKFRSEVLASSVPGVLPVRFEYFTATKQGNAVLLNWKLGQSNDVSSFEIYRSVNGSDFVLLSSVTALPGQVIYSLPDNNITTSKVYYRIKVTEITASIYWSSVRSVSFGTQEPVVKIYPNPVAGDLFSIVINSAGNKKVNIYNNSGALCKQYQFTETAKDISAAGWAKGYYWMQIDIGDGNLITQKLLVQ